MLSSRSNPKGVLTVQVLEAKNLKNEDTIGHNDPYVELWLDEEYKQKTSVQKNADEPAWNETFTFNIEEGSKVHKLHFKVLDKDKMDTEKIGDADFEFDSALNGEPLDTWVKLPAHLGLSDHGEVHFLVTFEAQ
ncbi:C2 domain-containing protein [Zychaea mexicana]|uniref:C2 domain-containing protein n=1 Tax=Zychaea mexicana TaxID=64656 RepID=UPI0022FEEF9B|nr:C2 domain-containing protein [Zychaea mexicana]KAI9489441.1 C2 domain-containing protein [Zychaea mexicana]